MLIENLKLFLRIVEKKGLAAAGRDMGLAPATVSERLSALELHYGARLLTRTTRAISLTDEGRLLVASARRILSEAEEIEARIKLGADTLSGTLHVTAPVDLGRTRLVPLLDGFMAEHPNVDIDLMLSDGYVDLVGQGVDLGLRYGALSDSSMRARKLGNNRRLVCAAPHYLEKFGIPHHPDDLVGHNCLTMRFGHVVDREWCFLIDGKRYFYRVQGNRIANDGSLIRNWCLEGYGLALKSEWDVSADLEKGNLVTVLDRFECPPNALHIVYPAGVSQPRRVRVFMDYLSAAFVPAAWRS